MVWRATVHFTLLLRRRKGKWMEGMSGGGGREGLSSHLLLFAVSARNCSEEQI